MNGLRERAAGRPAGVRRLPATRVTKCGTLDRAAFKGLPAGSFVHLPAGMPHYAHAEVETIVQINGVGPFDVTYINPADDPRAQ
jgi:hypothetical protein